MTQEDTARQLNQLIKVCKDGQQGFETAAENIRNSELESTFRRYAKQRAEFAKQLEEEVERLGGEAGDSGSVGAAIHRGWMDLKSALTAGSAGAIVGACESGEDNAEAAYSRANDAALPGRAGDLVTKQFQQIKESATRIRRLKREIEDGTEFPKNE